MPPQPATTPAATARNRSIDRRTDDQGHAEKASAARTLIAALGFIAISALIWFVGPLIAIADVRPLDGELARWIAITTSGALAAAVVAARSARSARSNRRLLDELAGSAAATPGQSDVAAIGKRFEEAVALLRRTRIGGKRPWLAALSGRPYVYQLPWYIIIGAPGAGKTTALANSGLEFPLASRLGKPVVRGVGGTRNCDWWFTNEAVLIDTAGRFTTQDSDRAADQAAWSRFLDLLVRYRPRRPINGVLLTLSVSDLLNGNAEEQRIHAQKLRARIDELQARFGIDFPIYVLVTKVDLLAGFIEFFSDFDKDERAQVWGITLPYAEKRGAVAPEPLSVLSAELVALEKRLDECLIDRLRSESDRERRGAIYAFPQQWRVLRETLHGFLQSTFAQMPAERAALVRGVYFTSATQEGTPMDRALGGLARALGLVNRLVAPTRPTGKAFFVTRLLRDVVFAESGLAGSNLRWMRSRLALRWTLAGALIGAVGLALSLAWHAYRANEVYVARLGREVQQLETAAVPAKNSPPTDVVALVPVLDGLARLRAQADPTASAGVATPMWLGLALDQSERLHAAAEDASRRVMKETFVPRIAARLEQRLRRADQEHVELVYEALKAYRMLFGGQHFDAAALRAYLLADWKATLPASVSAGERAALASHLRELLAGGEVGAPELADQALIEQARRVVAGVPLAQRVYVRLQALDPGPSVKPFSIVAAGGPAAEQVFVRASGRPLSEPVPPLYTRTVYPQSLRARSAEVLRQFSDEQAWVLGAAAAPATAEPPAQLIGEVEQLYLSDYVKVWDEYLGDLRIKPSGDLLRTAELAQILARPDSPLVGVLQGAVREVALEPQATAAAKATRGAEPADPKHPSFDRFDPLRQFVVAQPSPLNTTTELLAKLSTYLAAVDDALKRKSQPPASDVIRDLAASAERAPEPVAGMLKALASRSAGQAFGAIREPLARQLAVELGSPCARLVEGRYPFDRGAREEISREDFARTFAAGGLVDGFFRRSIAPYVDATGRSWNFADADGKRSSSDALLQFQRAQLIRDALFRDGGRRLGVRLEFSLIEMDPGLGTFTLDLDGQVLRFSRDARRPQTATWPGDAAPGNERAALRITARGSDAGSNHVFEGPWGLFRMLDRVRLEPGSKPDRALLTFDVEGRRAKFEVKSSASVIPIRMQALEQFRCPRSL